MFGIIFFVSALGVGIYFGLNYRPNKIWLASAISNKREHFLACEELPFYPQVQKVFAQHQDAVLKVKDIEGVTDFRFEMMPCKIYEGGIQFIKGDAVLEYISREARSQAEKNIGQNFFGMPYRGIQKN